jgi:hypothetical protein
MKNLLIHKIHLIIRKNKTKLVWDQVIDVIMNKDSFSYLIEQIYSLINATD